MPSSVALPFSPSPQYLLAEDLHLTSLDAETILEAGEFLETMQDYLDSSVISIIEDFSSLTEVWSALWRDESRPAHSNLLVWACLEAQKFRHPLGDL